MAMSSELELYHMPIASSEFGNDPLPYFAKARERHEWLAASDIGYVLTGYRAIDDILRLDDKLTMPGEEIVGIMRAKGTGWGDFAVEQMLVSSGERHKRLRGSASTAFGPGNVKRLRPLMQETVRHILDEWAPRGAFYFTEFASQFLVRVMFALLGTSTERLPEIMKYHADGQGGFYLSRSRNPGLHHAGLPAHHIGPRPGDVRRPRHIQPRTPRKTPYPGLRARHAYLPRPVPRRRQCRGRHPPDRPAHRQSASRRASDLEAVSGGLGDYFATD